ncbi:MAG: Gfo/Idh/MocA family oxidoreductase [Prolixibacteraceae bacterium]
MNFNKKRRDFLKTSGLVLSGLFILPSGIISCKDSKKKGIDRKISPSDKINMAFVGIGNRGGQVFSNFMQLGLVNNVAFCDTDMGAQQTLKAISEYPDVPRFKDFRVMFDKMANKIDAVCICVPDFSHFPITMLSMALGKHVYVEKPLSRTFYEAELLMAAAERHGVVTQMGNQGHSGENYFQFKEWQKAGIIKDVTRVTAHMNNSRRWHGWDTNMKFFPEAQTIPDTLDWNTWLTTAQEHGYHKDFVNGQWRCWYDFGMGALGDWGAHIMDSVHEFLNLGLPYEVDPVRIEGHNPLFFPQTTTLDFKFPERNNMPACTISWFDGVNNIPEIPKGYGISELDPNIPATGEGNIKPAKLNPGKIIYSNDLIFKGGSHSSPLQIIPEEAAKDMASKLPEVPESPSNHYDNFVLGVRGEEKVRSPFSIAGPLSQVFCLGTIAQRLNTRIEFDRITKQVTNNAAANQLLIGNLPRKGWEEFYRL